MTSIHLAAAVRPLPLEAGINFNGINTILGLIAGLVVMVAGITIANKGRSGNFRKAAESGGAVLIGVFIFAIGTIFAVASGAAGSAVRFLLAG